MKGLVPNASKQVHTRILFSIILGIVGSLIISSTILYVNFERIALKQVYRSDLNSLMQTSREVSKMTETAKSLSYQIYLDYTISSLLNYSNPIIYDVISAMKQLDYYRLSLPFIESIYVYNGSSKEIFISSNNSRNGRQDIRDVDDRGIIEILDNFHDHLPFVPIPRSYKVGSLEPINVTEVSSYTYLCYNILNQFLDYAIVINIDESWIRNDLEFPHGSHDGQTFIINEEGILFSPNNEAGTLTDFSNKSYMKQILNDDNSSYFEHTIDNKRSLITYTSPDALGWRYIRITPYENFTHEIKDMRMMTIYIGLGILLVGVLLSIIMSRRLTTPIHSIMDRMKLLESERRNSMYILRQNTLRDIFMGRVSYSSAVLQQKFSYLGSQVQVDQPTLLALFKIDGFANGLDKYNDDLKLYKYAIMNICTELAVPLFNVEALDLGEDSVLLMLSTADDKRVEHSELEILLREMQASIREHLKFTVSITISPVNESVEQSIRTLKQVIEASLHRLFSGHGSLFYSEVITAMKTKEYEYPVYKEKQLVESIMTGKTEEAKRIYSEIIAETAEYPYTVVSLAISHLTLTVNRVINTIKKNNSLELDPELDTTLLSLSHVETIEEINVSFYYLFELISKKLDNKRNSKYDTMVKKMNEIIDRDYGNPSLCLNSIAEEMDMSPIYISRLYKQLTLNALTEVIQEVRMNKAKSMLLNTNDSVADIAEKTGFTNSSYFYRMFKKMNGVTPNDYRKGIHQDSFPHTRT